MQRIAVYEPTLGTEELDNLGEALAANELIRGRFADRFEAQIASYVGTRFGVGTNSGTAAIHSALMVAGVKAGDEVLITTLTFIAPANAIAYCGAHPVFVDVAAHNWQMDPAAARRFCEDECRFDGERLVNRATGRPVTAIVLVHFLGMPADVEAFQTLAQRYNLILIEDAAQALGTRFGPRMVGGFGRIGCYSFYGNKLITAGGGGMLVTDDPALAQRARYLINQAKDDPVETLHRAIGYNYRMTNIHGAIGCAQFDRIDHHVARKRQIAARYRDGLAGQPGITLPEEPADQFWTFWLTCIRIDPAAFGLDARQLVRRLGEQGVETIPLYQPLHQSEAHAGAGRVGGQVAESLHAQVLTLPSSISLGEADQDRVIDLIVEAGERARAAAAAEAVLTP
jgi:dTDP-4-amino-4,6-dideoxygalactose transaminase